MLAKDLRFLVIDDHFLIRNMVDVALKQLGVNMIDYAPEGKSGVKKIDDAHTNGTPYHIVFLDYNMPGMNGFEVLDLFRGDHRNHKTAVVMLTSESEDEYIVKALEKGATAYITKPFVHAQLVQKIEELVLWVNKKS